MNDPAILDRIRRGERAAFETIFRDNYARLVGIAERMLRDRAAAEDVVQGVFYELWQRRETAAAETSLQGYLYRSVRNRSLNQLRHAHVRRQAEPELAAASPSAPRADSDAEQAEIASAVAQAMAELPARCREVFELSRVHGLRYSEIAEAMDISVKTVEVQMGKALRHMRERLSPWLPDG